MLERSVISEGDVRHRLLLRTVVLLGRRKNSLPPCSLWRE
jgi:hypothetical protein